MVMVLFLGLYIIRSGLWISGAAIIALASLFLLYSAGKSSLTLCFAVLLLTSVTSVVRSFWLRAIILLTPLVLLNLLERRHRDAARASPGFRSCCRSTRHFTGRTDIWAFALQSLHARLLTGYGFASFWGSSAIQNLPEGKEWAGFAAHSHNGYLDTALGMGVPGLLLLILVLVIVALEKFSAGRRGRQQRPARDDAAADLAVRALFVGDGKLLPRPVRSPVVHVPDGGLRPALSRAVPGGRLALGRSKDQTRNLEIRVRRFASPE